MSTAAATHKEAGIPGLTPSETKLIALGVAFTKNDGKVDYDKVAEYGGYTKGSASVLYRKAHKKLMEAYNLTNVNADDDGAVGPATPAKPPKTKARGSASAKKRKGAAETTPGAPGAEDTANGDAVEAETPTKPKRQRKTPAKKGAAAAATAAAVKEEAAEQTTEHEEVAKDEEASSAAAIKAEDEGDAAAVVA